MKYDDLCKQYTTDGNYRWRECKAKMLNAKKEILKSKFTSNLDFYKFGRLGCFISPEENRLVIPLNKKLYQFDYVNRGRYALESGYHISYLKSISIELKSRILDVWCVGYHMNAAPFDSDFVADHIFDIKRRRSDAIIRRLVEPRWLCIGNFKGQPFTFENVMAMLDMLQTPYAHTRSFEMFASPHPEPNDDYIPPGIREVDVWSVDDGPTVDVTWENNEEEEDQ